MIWNEAFSVGGPACTIRQFEQVTDIRIDNYIVIDFQGFKDMVNALDGVEVCIPEDIDDPEHGITLDAGTREIRDDEALSYVRVRAVGDGTDPNRIRRQQAFMAAMINKAISAGMLVRPDRMVSFLNAVTGSIQTDYNNIAELADLGRSFQGIGLDNIKFVTTPWVYSTAQDRAGSSGPGRSTTFGDWCAATSRSASSSPRSRSAPPTTRRAPARRPTRRRDRRPHRRVDQRWQERQGRGAVRRRARERRALHMREPRTAETDWERRSRLAAVFGDALPESPATRRTPPSRADGDSASDRWLKSQVPPHHG